MRLTPWWTGAVPAGAILAAVALGPGAVVPAGTAGPAGGNSLPVAGATAQDDDDDDPGLGPPAVYTELREAAPKAAGRIAAGARLQIDRFELEFDGGDLFLLPPIDSRDTVAIYQGRGTFHAYPPDGVELQQLQKLIEADRIEEEFERFIVWFTGDLGERLRALADISASGGDAGRAADLLDDRREKLREDRLLNPDARVAANLWRASREPPLPDAERDFVFLEIDGREHDWFTVEIEPLDPEEVGVTRYDGGHRMVDVWMGAHAVDDFDAAAVTPTLGRFPRDPEADGPFDPDAGRDDDDDWTAADYGLSPRVLEPDDEPWQPRVSISRADVDLAIERNGDVEASVALVVEPLVDLATLRVLVSPLAEVTDVRWRTTLPDGVDDVNAAALLEPGGAAGAAAATAGGVAATAGGGDDPDRDDPPEPDKPAPLLGESIHFVQEKHDRRLNPDLYEPRLVILLPRAVAAGERFILEIAYEGELIERLRDASGYYLKDSVYWIPRHPDNRRRSFHLTFRTPERYRIASGGVLADERVEDDTRIMRWITAQTVRNTMSFHMGRFEIDEVPADALAEEGIDLPSIAVYADRHHVGFAPGNREKTIEDLIGSIRTYTDYFGPYPFESLLVTETREYGGQAFPGLVLLTFQAFGTLHTGEQELFRSHEVAHQWWGAGVDWESYRDQWISEGFAHYSAALYALMGLEDEDQFLEMIDAWRLDVLGIPSVGQGLGLKRYGFLPQVIQRSDAHESGPLVVGFRLRTTDTPADYRLIAYEKGAFILHMLRMLLLDPETGDDERFRALMRRFTDDHIGGVANTRRFEAAVTEAFGEPMDWFFDQWVYGVDVPEYRPDLDVVDARRIPAAGAAGAGDGGRDDPAARELLDAALRDAPFVLRGTVRQEEVPAGFRMPVPIRVTFDDRPPILRRIWIDQPEVAVEIPLPAEPDEVEFNWHHGVLARVR